MLNFRAIALLFSTAGWAAAQGSPDTAKSYNFQAFDVPDAAANLAVLAIDDSGTVAGYYTDASGAVRSFIRLLSGQFTQEITAPHDNAKYTAILGSNNKGTFVGTHLHMNVYTRQYQYNGFFLKGNVWTKHDFPGPYSTSIWGINDRGVFVGTFGSSVSANQGFISIGGTYTQVSCPAPGMCGLAAINNTGVSVGAWRDAQDTWHGMIRDASGNVTPYDYPHSSYTVLSGINDLGTLSGTFTEIMGQTQCFVRYSDGIIQAINYPNNSMLTSCGKINNSGWLTGVYIDAAGVEHGFIAEPAS